MTKPITKFNDLMTQSDIAKYFTRHTGKSTGSSAYTKLLVELKRNSIPSNLGTSVLYYPKEDVESIFCFKLNNEEAIKELKEDLKSYLEFHLNEQIDRFTYLLNSNQQNLIQNQHDFFDRTIGHFQQKYRLNLEIKNNYLLFEKRA